MVQRTVLVIEVDHAGGGEAEAALAGGLVELAAGLRAVPGVVRVEVGVRDARLVPSPPGTGGTAP